MRLLAPDAFYFFSGWHVWYELATLDIADLAMKLIKRLRLHVVIYAVPLAVQCKVSSHARNGGHDVRVQVQLHMVQYALVHVHALVADNIPVKLLRIIARRKVGRQPRPSMVAPPTPTQTLYFKLDLHTLTYAKLPSS